MKKTMIALSMAVALVVSAFTSSANAQGHAEKQFFRALGVGAAIGLGAAAFGAAARANVAPPYRAYAPVEGYYYYPGYAAAPVVSCQNGFWAARIVGRDQWNRPIYGKPRWVCPPTGYSYSSYYYRY